MQALKSFSCVYAHRTFSGKVRKLKQHRRASASRLRPPGAPPSTAVAPAAGVVDESQPQQPHADGLQSNSGPFQLAQAQQAQHTQQALNLRQHAAQQQPLLMQSPGFSSAEKLRQQVQGQFLQEVIPRDDKQLKPQLLQQLPEQLHEQQPPMRRDGRRQRPSADAGEIACFGKAVQDEQGRMTQSGPLQSGVLHQPSAVSHVPELFEVRCQP